MKTIILLSLLAAITLLAVIAVVITVATQEANYKIDNNNEEFPSILTDKKK